MQGEFRILDRTGHTSLVWDTETKNFDPLSGPLDPVYVNREFDRLVKANCLVFTERDGQDVMLAKGGQVIEPFDPQTMEKVTVVPAFAGG